MASFDANIDLEVVVRSKQLDQLEKIISYESKRQHGLILIAEKLKKLSIGN